MSAELNAENRNAINTVIPPAVRRRPCCSFCRREGHRITTCNDQRIENFEKVMLCELKHIIYMASMSIDNISTIKRRFNLWLCNKYSSIISRTVINAYAIRKCNISVTVNVSLVIYAIIAKMEPYINMTEQIEPNINISLIDENTFQTIEQSNQIDINNNDDNYFINILSSFLIVTNHLSLNQIERTNSHQEVMRQLEESRENTTEIFNNYVEQSNIFDLLLNAISIDALRNLDNSITNLRTLYRDNNYKPTIKIQEFNPNLENNINLDDKCECNICYESREKKNYVKLNCGHEFCKECIVNTLKSSNYCCALCRTDMKSFELYDKSIKSEFNDLIINNV